jgi:predicted ester cyclase
MVIRMNMSKEGAVSVEENKRAVRRVFEEAFNRGELAVIDAVVADRAIDHQHPDDPSFAEHLKQVVVAMRTAFPDLHFAITELIGEGDWVALHSVMTGTNTGELGSPLLPPGAPAALPPTGRPVRVAHMHMIRSENGRNTELLHLMDTMAMVGQLGLAPAPGGISPGARREIQ